MKEKPIVLTLGFWLAVGILIYSIWYIFFSLPNPLFHDPYSKVLMDRDNQLLSARVAQDGQWRFPIVDTLSEKYSKAVIAFEDKRFRKHNGVDGKALCRAALQNIQSGTIVSGGSTITMQLIRMASKNPPRTILQKVREVILATRLEWTWSKDHILQSYASHAPFGGNVVGIEAATWRYFGKNALSISWAEAALLAVLPNNPSMLHPGRGRKPLLAKRNRLLNSLFEAGTIDNITLETALSEPIPPAPRPLPNLAPHLTDRLTSEQSEINNGVFRTTIDKSLQENLNALAQRHGRHLSSSGIYNLAIIIQHVATGEILGYVGNIPNAQGKHGQSVDIIRSSRSTGSILKPLLYGAALQEGKVLSRSFLLDHPINFNGYRPKNFSSSYSGAVPANLALSRSLNIPFIQLLQQYGSDRFYNILKSHGLTTLPYQPEHYGLSLILGGAEVRLDEITSAYSYMARTLNRYHQTNGQYYDESAYRGYSFYTSDGIPEITDPLSRDLIQQPLHFRVGAIWKTLEAMRQVERPNDRGGWEYFLSQRPVAWKTGTSFGFRDAWAIGVTPDYTVGVWVGNADGTGRPDLIGIKAAGPLMFDAFALLPPTGWWQSPLDDLENIKICSVSGDLSTPNCPAISSLESKSIHGGIPCRYHKKIHTTPDQSYQVDASCYPQEDMQHLKWFTLPPRMAYYYRSEHPEWKPIPPIHPNCQQLTSNQAVMRLIYPQAPRRILVPRNMDGSWSRTVFELAHQRPATKVYWHIDDRFIGATETFHAMELFPEPGDHVLTLVDADGNRLTQKFTIQQQELEE